MSPIVPEFYGTGLLKLLTESVMGHPCAAFVLVLVAAWIQPSVSQENAPPTWIPSSYAPLSNPGVPEFTRIGTQVATLLCVDPEGEPVVYRIPGGGETFAVETETGNLFTKKNITITPEEAATGISVVFECIDIDLGTRRPRNRPEWARARTKWTVNDINDKAPVFQTENREGYFYQISEDAPPGTTLTPPITIVDRDFKPQNVFLSSLTFICENQTLLASLPRESRETCKKFRITYASTNEKGRYVASVILKDNLDYEEFPVYDSVLVAVDGQGGVPKQTGQTTIQITVLDAQDQPPEFTNPGSSVSVSEDVRVGTTLDFGVSARDGDRGAFRPMALEIISDPRNLFSLGPALLSSDPRDVGVFTSRLVVQNQLDRENISDSYELVIRAIELNDKVNPPARTDDTATATYSVFVTDINDNKPEFEETFITVNVTEFTGLDRATYIPTTISGLHITCNDKDEGSNAEYRVVIENQTYPDAFSISPQRPSYRGKADLFLQVDDFNYMNYDVAAYRNQVVVLKATEIVNSGQSPSFCTVSINLVDINDNTPTFPQRTYDFAISESVDSFPYPIHRFSVTDRDSGLNQEVRFSLANSFATKFGIDEVTGELSLLSQLDYEQTPRYVFSVVARDQAPDPRSSQVQVIIRVLDFNDIGPRFTQPSWETSANESSRFFLNPITITAIDDEDPNAPITYRIVSGQSPNNAFVLSRNTGRLSLAARLDYDETPTLPNGQKSGAFRLMVEASDNGNPPQTNQVEVTVRVIDENNHSPVLDPVTYTSTIPELAPAGTFVAQINGTDDDGGAFGRISFRLGPGSSNNFQVDQNTGVVSVAPATNFDFDTTKSYRLTILATDGGAPQQTATATVFVTITDSNNQAPTFPQYFYTKRVNENTPRLTVVLTLTARDLDSTSSLVYSILPETYTASDGGGNLLRINNVNDYDFTAAFAINPTNGEIYVNGPLDKDAAQDITFEVQVQDVNAENQQQVAKAQVSMIVEGEPDNTIVFDPIPVLYVDEDEDVGHSIITLTARDPGSGTIVKTFEKLAGSSRYLDLNDARVVLAEKLDYEADSRPQELIVRAVSEDLQRSATATVTVSILDVNDNAPKFQQDEYFATVSEFAKYPDYVTRILATDDDSSSFSTITYRIVGGLDSNHFTLLELSQVAGAEVLVAPGVRLDYNRRPVYRLVIEAQDNADGIASATRQRSTVVVTVNVIDENDNSPKFVDDYLRNVVPETAEVGDTISVVQATDADEGRNGEITYSLVPGSDDLSAIEGLSLFGISPTEGRIFVAGSLLGLGGRTFNFFVQARDSGDSPRTGRMELEIFVLSTQANDGSPRWNSPPVNYVVYAPEETPGYQLTQLRYDVTPQEGDTVTYFLSTLSEGYENFIINSTSGLITIVGSLDREVKPQYKINVFATDTVNGKASGRIFIVRLTDNDDNDATFTNPKDYPVCGAPIDRPLVVGVVENTAPNTTVYQLRACDPDGPKFNAVIYTPFNQNEYCRREMENSAISVTTDGRLVTNRIIDYEQNKEFIMCVEVNSVKLNTGRRKRAVDLTQVPDLDNVAIILLTVEDVNDHGPEFPRRQEVAVVYTSPTMGPVHILDAVDKDGRNYNTILYIIDSSVFYRDAGASAIVVKDAFELRGDRGAIYPKLPSYEQYEGGRFVLRISAIDSVDNSRRDSQTLVIYVYKRGDVMRLVLNQPPATGVQNGPVLIQELSRVNDETVLTYISATENRISDGVNLEKTDVCFVAINTKDHEVLNVRQVLSVLSDSDSRAVLNDQRFKVEGDTGKCYSVESSEEKVKWRDLWWVLVAVAIFLFVCCIICLILVSILYENYKQYMETRKTYLVQQ